MVTNLSMKPSCSECPAPCAAGECAAEAGRRLGHMAGLLTAHGVAALWLHGSRARGQHSEYSDWDFVAQFARPVSRNEYERVRSALQAAFEAHVHLTCPQYARDDFIDVIQYDLVQVYP